jgi:hypothetical protein
MKWLRGRLAWIPKLASASEAGKLIDLVTNMEALH